MSVLTSLARRRSGLTLQAVVWRLREDDAEAGLLAHERGYLTVAELAAACNRQSGWPAGRFLDALVAEGTLLGWQRDEVEDLLADQGCPPVPWEELGAGD